MRRLYDVDQLLREYCAKPKPGPGVVVNLAGIPDMDGYNPSRAIPHAGATYHYVRVEPRDEEFTSWAVPFLRHGDTSWEVDHMLPRLHLQDPFTTTVHGQLVVGGVRILGVRNGQVEFETPLYSGDSPDTLCEFARGPVGMKDIRLLELTDGAVGIFTRPLGGFAGRGCIGYTEVPELADISTEVMADAPLLPVQPIAEHWWGANDVYALPENRIGVLGHIAKREGEVRHYYPITLVLDRATRQVVDGPTIVCDRTCFPVHEPKRRWLEDVIFPAGLDRKRGLLFGGLSDSAIGVIEIGDPFAAYISSDARPGALVPTT
jgi:hypothetical protein